jgi:serine/threonine protein kinase
MSAATEKLGRYRLLEPIATGGMAEIHLASAEGAAGFEKLVAIKRIRPERARNAEFVAMFLNEARIAATLHHGNVVQTYDFGHEDGSFFLAMEYLRGHDVQRIVQALARANRQMPLEVAIAIVAGIAAGLHYLHEKRDADRRPLGLVHRDVSPQNIFVTSDGGVKLLDFGIVKAVHRADGTRTGAVKGKLAYMSPEQCRAEALDRRTDIFSLSIVLWELTVGRRLYARASDMDVMNAIDKVDAPRPSGFAPHYPADLEGIVMKGLARDRGARYQTTEELLADLEGFAREHKLTITPRSVSSVLRSLSEGGDGSTLAPLQGSGPPVASEAETRLDQHGAGAPTRALMPKRPRSSRRAALFAAVVLLLAAAGGLGAVWLSKRLRPKPPLPAATAPPPPAEKRAAPPVAPPPAAVEPAPVLPAAQEPGGPAEPARKRDRPRRPRPRGTIEKWSPDSALLPP